MIPVDWRFNPPPLSPWHGGFYERLVAVVKAPLRRVLRKSLLALDELSTILLEIEHVVNDRPITYVAGVEEPPPLTPNMLAGSQIGRVDIQEESISHRGANRRIQYFEQLRDALTKRWEQEYITALRSHHQVKNYSFAVDDIVLLDDEKKKRQDWKLARKNQTVSRKRRPCACRSVDVRRTRISEVGPKTGPVGSRSVVSIVGAL